MSKESHAQTESFSMRSLIGPIAAIVIGMIMVMLDDNIINVAIPTLVKDFHSTLPTIQWTITIYTLSLSAVIPLAGWLSDKLGAKRLFLLILVLFTLASVLCSTASSAGLLITYRVIQGLVGGMILPVGFAFVFRLAPPNKVGSIMGMLGIPMLLAPALAPMLSGWLVEYLSWHWIFLINLPLGIIGFVVGLIFLPRVDRKTTETIDVLGMFLGPAAFVFLSYALNEGGKIGWGALWTVLSLVIGIVVLLAFVVVEVRHRSPLVELKTFKSGNFARGVLALLISQFALFGSIFLITQYLLDIRGFGELQTGLILMPQAVAAGIFMAIGGRLFDKVGARPLAITGFTIITIALFWISRNSIHTGILEIIIPLILMGIGMGFSMMQLNTYVLQAAPREFVHRVTPLTSAGKQIMVSFAVSGLTGFLTSRTTHYMQGGGNAVTHSTAAFSDTFLFAAAIAFIGLLLSFFIGQPKKDQEKEVSVNPERRNEPS